MIKSSYKFNDGIIEANYSQDVGALLKMCERKRNDENLNDRAHKEQEFKHYAEVPVIFVEQWMRDYGITNMGKALADIMFRKVNTEFPAFKVTNTYEKAKNV